MTAARPPDSPPPCRAASAWPNSPAACRTSPRSPLMRMTLLTARPAAAELRPAWPPRRPAGGPAHPGTAVPVRGLPPDPRCRPPGAGSSRTAAGPSHVTAAPEYQATTTQLCGLYPFVAGSGTPTAGTPVGRHQLWGEVVCLDPLAWLRAGLVTNPGDVRPRPARHRQVRPGQTAGHRRGRDRHPGAHPRRHQTRLHAADRAPRRPGDPGRPRPGPDQPAGRRAARRRAAPHDRPGRAGSCAGRSAPGGCRC